MALEGKSLKEVLVMDAKEREVYFFVYASYMEDGPMPYAIRVGLKGLMSHDTADLRKQFENYIRKMRRKRFKNYVRKMWRKQ